MEVRMHNEFQRGFLIYSFINLVMSPPHRCGPHFWSHRNFVGSIPRHTCGPHLWSYLTHMGPKYGPNPHSYRPYLWPQLTHGGPIYCLTPAIFAIPPQYVPTDVSTIYASMTNLSAHLPSHPSHLSTTHSRFHTTHMDRASFASYPKELRTML